MRDDPRVQVDRARESVSLHLQPPGAQLPSMAPRRLQVTFPPCERRRQRLMGRAEGLGMRYRRALPATSAPGALAVARRRSRHNQALETGSRQ